MDLEQKLPDTIRKRYVRKFTLVVLVIAVLVGGTGLVTQIEVSEQVRDNRQAELQNIAGTEADALEEWLKSQRERTALLSENDEFEDLGTREELDSALSNQARRFPESLHAVYYVTGVDWRTDTSSLDAAEINASTVEEQVGEPLAVDGMRWGNGFSFADDNAVDESNVYERDGKKFIAFASPVEDSDAVIVAVFDTTEHSPEFSDRIESGYTQVVSGQGEIQFTAGQDETLSQYDAGTNTEEIIRGVAGESGILERGGDVIAYAPVEGTDWVLVKYAPKSNAYTLSRLVTERLLALIGITLFGFGLLIVVLARGTIPRLVDLTGSARALASGTLNQEIADTNRIDEIGEVQHAFRETQSYMRTVAAQADAIADREFEADIFQKEVPGDIGIALDQMRHDLEESITELEASNKKLEEFAYVASHDLQEPLRMISSYMELLQAELDDDLDAESEEYFEFAIDGAERMQAMIEGLLTFSRVQTQANPFEDVDVTQIVENTLQDLKLKIDNADAEVTAGDLPTITADGDQLGQVFQNLIKNAIEHGGVNTIVDITAEQHATTTEFSVSDNGPGIPDHLQDSIFNIFDKGGDSEGTGIGLAVCQEIIERHDGEIWVESTEGEGTTFHFTIADNPE